MVIINMWVDRNSTLTTCISGGLILNNACVAPDIFVVYLRFNVVIAIWLEVMAFDETDSRWRSWVCAAGFVLIYASELTKCSILVISPKSVYRYLILFTCPGQPTCLCRRLNPWSLKFVILLNQWLKQPASVRSRYLAVTLLPITYEGLIARPSGRGMGVRELQVWPKFYARILCCMQYRDISRVYSMFLWLAVFWRYEWRFMG